MNIVVRSLWFLLTIVMGILAGVWVRQLIAAPYKASATNYPKPEATVRPKPAVRPATTYSVAEPLTVEAMDTEVKNGPRNDRNYMVVGWFGGDFVRQGKAVSMARTVSNGQYDWPRDNYRRDFLKATTEEDKRRLYHEWSRQRIYSMIYTHEIAKEEGLLVRPGDKPLPPVERHASGGVTTDKPAESQETPQQPKTFQ